jgi:hypothetical protein
VNRQGFVEDASGTKVDRASSKAHAGMVSRSV